MLFSPADFLTWLRCRRQWMRRCLVEPRRPAFPVEMTGEATLRETARVIAEAVRRVAPEADDLHRKVFGPTDVPAVADVIAVVLDSQKAAEWAAATVAAIGQRREFVHGVLVVDSALVLVDHAVFHGKMDGWRFSIFRPGTGVRGVYQSEAALIAAAAEQNGVSLAGLHLYYLNKHTTLVQSSDVDMAELYTESNMLKRAQKGVYEVRAELAELVSAASGQEIDTGYRCSQGCDICTPRPRNIRDRFSVRTLHKGGEVVRKLIEEGITDIREIPPGYRGLTEKQRIQIDSVVNDALYIDPPQLQHFVSSLEYPVFYLDFEGFAASLPFFAGLSPYEHTPVIASIHVQRERYSPPEGRLFVAETGKDQRASFFSWMLDVVGTSGSIVVFGRLFEVAMIRQLAARAGQETEGRQITQRMVDLLVPFSEFRLYHPEQRGKISLKRVLPAFSDEQNYQNETVKDGMHANLGLIRLADGYAIAAHGVPPSIVAGARAAEGVNTILDRLVPDSAAYLPGSDEIAAYCAVDTIAMYHLVRRMEELARQGSDQDRTMYRTQEKSASI